jgi:hypothetical protein
MPIYIPSVNVHVSSHTHLLHAYWAGMSCWPGQLQRNPVHFIPAQCGVGLLNKAKCHNLGSQYHASA